jgi:SAM-dependent methyltransferase
MDLQTYVDTSGLFGRHGFAALERQGRELFGDTTFREKHVLEVGAGDGLVSLWLLERGARSVVSLEPEAAGATHGVAALAGRHRAALGYSRDRWEYRSDTLQRYKPDRAFGLVVSHASINHLDEPACERLGWDDDARATYTDLFGLVRNLLGDGGHFVAADVGRRNLWGAMGWASPWAPEIEWHKHQEPETWCELLTAAGLSPVAIRWRHPFFRLGPLGSLLENKYASRCLASQFAITARRTSPVQSV